MKLPKPLIKFNDGKPIALCNRCFCIMCYVSCDVEDFEVEGKCTVIKRNGDGDADYIDTPIGKVPPAYCNSCNFLLLKFSLNE